MTDQKIQKYAVVRIGGKQYKVKEGQEILVDKLNLASRGIGKLVDPKKPACEVLLASDGNKVLVGKPVLKNVEVKLKVVTELEKGEKVEIYKFKAKSRYKRHTGFRAQYTRLLVEKIA
jgi:large subunit ribosomal protein L21